MPNFVVGDLNLGGGQGTPGSERQLAPLDRGALELLPAIGQAAEFMVTGETATQRAARQPIPPVGGAPPVPEPPAVLPMWLADP